MPSLSARLKVLEMSSVYCGIRPPNMSDGEFVAYVAGMVGPERARFMSAMSDNDLSASIALLAGAALLTEQEQHAPA